MSHSATQFITQMRLRELRRQRAKLREAYEGLRGEVAGVAGPGARLRRLYDGLRGLAFAGRPLHPDVVNLEVLLHEVDAGTAAPEVLALWLGRLEEELEAGRARSEVVYLFGAPLGEGGPGGAGRGRPAGGGPRSPGPPPGGGPPRARAHPPRRGPGPPV